MVIIKVKSICKQKSVSRKTVGTIAAAFLAASVLVPLKNVRADESNGPQDATNIKQMISNIDDSNQPLAEQIKQIVNNNGNKPDEDINQDDVKQAAEFASNATGVRKDFLIGMLIVESNLGQNTGQCTYAEVENDAQKSHENGRLSDKAWQTFQGRRDTMKDIAKGLGYDYEKLKVSCNPGYVGTGGAMGISQFMPDIWMAYKDRIAQIVGKDNPDPWNVKDGVVAMALLVADTPGVTDHNLYAEKNAAKMYLSGSTSAQYNWYANQIIYWANNYKKIYG